MSNVRFNNLEEATRQTIYSRVAIDYEFGTASINTTKFMEKMNRDLGGNILYINAQSPYYTYNGNPHETEFVLFAQPLYARIECKDYKNESRMREFVFNELKQVKDLKEDVLMFVLNGTLNTPKFYSALVSEIKEAGVSHKVWYGSLLDFDDFLSSLNLK